MAIQKRPKNMLILRSQQRINNEPNKLTLFNISDLKPRQLIADYDDFAIKYTKGTAIPARTKCSSKRINIPLSINPVRHVNRQYIRISGLKNKA